MNAKSVFDKLVDQAHGWALRLSGTLYPNRHNRFKPGQLVEGLSPEEREELKNLKSSDIVEPDRNALGYMQGAYPDNNVSVYCHSVKKESDDR